MYYKKLESLLAEDVCSNLSKQNIDVIIEEQDDGFKLLKKYMDVIDMSSLGKTLYDQIKFSFDGEDLESLVSLLSSSFLLETYKGSKKEKMLSEYIKNNNISDIVSLFSYSKEFGYDVITAYLSNLLKDDEEKKKDEQSIYGSEYGGTYLKLLHNSREKKSSKIINFISLPDLARKEWVNLHNHYIQNGFSNDDALDACWTYFTNDLDPINDLDEYFSKGEEKSFFKSYMLRILYSDLIEDMANDPCYVSNDKIDESLKVLLSFTLAFDSFTVIPREDDLKRTMLDYFLFIQNNDKKIRYNREKTESDSTSLKVLKKINPIYMLDHISTKN